MKPIRPETWRGYEFSGVSEEESCTVYYLSDKDGGKGIMRVYEVLPGILMSYDILDMKSCYQDVPTVEGYIQINYCNEGCFEFELDTGEIGFIGQGDLAVCDPSSSRFVNSRIPYGKYRGISVMIQIEKAQQSISERIPEAELDLHGIARRIFETNSTYLIRANASLEHIFYELYHIDERISKPYMVLKVLELLCFINVSRYEDQTKLPCFTQSVVETVKAAHEYINSHFTENITVVELAVKFHISETNLCSCFKALYGQPVGTYIRGERIKYAAELLTGRTEMSVGDIAALVGYDNQSKFAAAFKSIQGYSPLAYRKRMKNANSEQKQEITEQTNS